MNVAKLFSPYIVAMLGAGLVYAQADSPADAKPPVAAGSEVVTPPVADAPTAAERAEQRAKAQATNAALGYDYKVGSGDQLLISVWKEPEASASVVVRPDGKISLALIKEVSVIGMTPVEVEAMITEKLSALITEPDVTVMVTGIQSQKIYLAGPGLKGNSTLPYTYQMNIMQAISEAGGLTDYAKRNKIYVLRTENGKEKKLSFDYDKAIKGDFSNNIKLLPGDTLVVP
jgi:polysaccharide export outer membrane protein